MPAPSGIKWGSEGTDGNGMKGKIGVHISVSNIDGGKTRATVQIWYWSRTKVEDYGNSFSYSTNGGSNYTDIGSVAIVTPSNTAWSTSNQVHVKTFTVDQTRGSTAKTLSIIARFSGIDWGGGSASVTATYTVPAMAKYTISYNANGGSNAPTSQVKNHGSAITLTSAVPTREGYIFNGWGHSGSGSVIYSPGDSYTNNESRTLYAIWSLKTYTVTYDANGGNTLSVPSRATKSHGTALTISSTVPTRPLYDFLGWHTSDNATEPMYVVGDKYTNESSVTLYAVWKLSYVKPRISTFSVSRCDSDGTENEAGSYAFIDCYGDTDNEGAIFAVYYKLTTEAEKDYKSAMRESLTGKEHKISRVITGSDGKPIVFNTEYAYNIKINLADSEDFTPATRVLNSLFIPVDFKEDMKSVTFGEPCTDDEDGLFKVAYENIDLAPKNRLRYKGEPMFGQKTLWEGNSIMGEGATITLSKPISEMKNGIVLVFARPGDYHVSAHFVPKQAVVSLGAVGWCFSVVTPLGDYNGAKTLFIGNSKISGHTSNSNDTRPHMNSEFELRYVYEV